MCGISGLLLQGTGREKQKEILQRMNRQQAHRGPDNEGAWLGENTCLGHRRLSIIDLSDAGNQPLSSPNGRFQMVYNGEIYNFQELRLELQRAAVGSKEQPWFFRTVTDSEVVLAAYTRWGPACLNRLQGMFAIAIYDTISRELFLARDRFGVKPLYYSFDDDGLVFASELRTVLKSGVRDFALSDKSVAEYALYQTVHSPYTIIKGIRMLPAGHYAVFSNGKAHLTKYYDPDREIALVDDDYSTVCRNVRELLADAVQKRLVADVPFGAFLSGGIDSSAIVALMSMVSSQKPRTFNVSFSEKEFSESHFANVVAKKYDTIHHEILLTPDDFLAQLPEALDALDHPGGDGPNTYIVSKATKNAGITMALSGAGGDELFAGYGVFKRMVALQRRSWLNAFPRPLRSVAGTAYAAVKPSVAASKIAELLSLPKVNLQQAYPLTRQLFTQRILKEICRYPDTGKRVENLIGEVPVLEGYLLSAVSRMEMSTYLENVLLRDADQMGMAVSLEIREPFLDHRLVNYVLGVPDRMKYPHSPKKLLTDSLGELLPAEIVNRPKMGFTLPWEHWMRNQLKSFCEMNMRRLAEKPQFRAEGVRRLWERFERSDKQVPWSRIWHLVVLNHWLDRNMIQ